MTITLEFTSGKNVTLKGIKTIRQEDSQIKLISEKGQGLGFLEHEVVMFYTVNENKNGVN